MAVNTGAGEVGILLVIKNRRIIRVEAGEGILEKSDADRGVEERHILKVHMGADLSKRFMRLNKLNRPTSAL